MNKKETTIKTISQAIETNVPNQIINKDVLQLEIIKTKEAEGLTAPAVKLSKLKTTFEKLEKEMKAAITFETDKAKLIKIQIQELEQALKLKALELVQVENKTLTSKTTGEVKRKLIHNLNTKVFSFTPKKNKILLDTNELLTNNKYKKYLMEEKTMIINYDKVDKEKADNLPWKETTTEARVSFKKVNDLKDALNAII